MKATGKAQRPPAGQSWVWLTRDLLESPAWRALSIQSRRLLDVLMIEHMRHKGRRNGFLLAPRRQLEQAGIHPSLVTTAIEEAEQLGFIDIRRGIGRRASMFSLTWLPFGDGAEPSNRWQTCSDAANAIMARRKHLKTRRKLRVAVRKM